LCRLLWREQNDTSDRPFFSPSKKAANSKNCPTSAHPSRFVFLSVSFFTTSQTPRLPSHIMDWLLGRKPTSQTQPPPPPTQSQLQHHLPPQQEILLEAPDIDSLLKPHDPAALHPLANLDKQTLDYIILEDEQIKSAGALPSRGWTDDLCYGTGTTYLTGTTPFAYFHLHLPSNFCLISLFLCCSRIFLGISAYNSARCRRHVGRHGGPPQTRRCSTIPRNTKPLRTPFPTSQHHSPCRCLCCSWHRSCNNLCNTSKWKTFTQ
jgi:hypothetical protein